MTALSKFVDEWVHATHAPKLADGTDAVVIKVHRHMPDGTVTPHLTVINKPARSFYITKPGCRTNLLKREWETLDHLDRYDVPNHRLADALGRALNGGFSRGGYQSIMQHCDSPYVYGADIHIESLIKHKFMKEFDVSGLKPSAITTGFLDIETDVVGGDGESPNIITVTHENRVYTAIQEKFLTVKQPDGSFRHGNLEEFIAFSKRTLGHHITKLLDDHLRKNPKSTLKQIVAAKPFEYVYYVGKTALDLIRWIFAEIHKNRTDFLGVWNIDSDIPRILAAIKQEGGKAEDIFCPPELDKKYRYVRYQYDEKMVPNVSRKWHWLHATSYSQFIDSMCLYSNLRIVKGMETSYALDNILQINDLGGKLTFKGETDKSITKLDCPDGSITFSKEGLKIASVTRVIEPAAKARDRGVWMAEWEPLGPDDGPRKRFRTDDLAVQFLEEKLSARYDGSENEADSLSGLDWHRYMQKNEAYKYVVYNQFDCISLQLMEWKNRDLESMLVLSGVSRLSKYTRQTRKIADSFYFYALADGKVMASPGQTMVDKFDDLIAKEGGAVLRPERTVDIGMRVFVDRPDIVTMLHPYTNDVDFSGMYPNATIVGNISKETKVSCGIEIEGFGHRDLWDYYSMAVSLRENAVLIGQTYFRLKGYEELDAAFTAHLAEQNAPPW